MSSEGNCYNECSEVPTLRSAFLSRALSRSRSRHRISGKFCHRYLSHRYRVVYYYVGQQGEAMNRAILLAIALLVVTSVMGCSNEESGDMTSSELSNWIGSRTV